jgi:AcrR family transcriptional regulator
MGRRSASEAAHTRQRIVAAAVDDASLHGLEGLTIGRLAERVQLSKSGLAGHFGSKERLQLVTLEAAVGVFRQEVWAPVEHQPSGRQRLLSLCDHWLNFLESGRFPGGCFFTTVSVEFDGRPGPVRDAVRAAKQQWLVLLEREIQLAQKAGEIESRVDPAQAAFEVDALVAAANMAYQLHDDRVAFTRARRGIDRILVPAQRSKR